MLVLFKFFSYFLKPRILWNIPWWLPSFCDNFEVQYNVKMSWKPSNNWSSRSEVRSSNRRCSLRKGVLRNFTKFTGKHLWWAPGWLLNNETLNVSLGNKTKNSQCRKDCCFYHFGAKNLRPWLSSFKMIPIMIACIEFPAHYVCFSQHGVFFKVS